MDETDIVGMTCELLRTERVTHRGNTVFRINDTDDSIHIDPSNPSYESTIALVSPQNSAGIDAEVQTQLNRIDSSERTPFNNYLSSGYSY